MSQGVECLEIHEQFDAAKFVKLLRTCLHLKTKQFLKLTDVNHYEIEHLLLAELKDCKISVVLLMIAFSRNSYFATGVSYSKIRKTILH